MIQTNEAQQAQPMVVRPGIKTVASAIAGATLGVVGGLSAMIGAAAVDIFLPVGLCLWTWVTGVAGGSIGLLFGTKRKPRVTTVS